MQRRSFLTSIGVLTVTPGSVTRLTPPPLPREGECGFFWRYVQHAIELGDAKYCTDRYLDMAVKRSQLDHMTDREVRRVIRAAFRGAYDEHDVPVEYRPSDRSI